MFGSMYDVVKSFNIVHEVVQATLLKFTGTLFIATFPGRSLSFFRFLKILEKKQQNTCKSRIY